MPLWKRIIVTALLLVLAADWTIPVRASAITIREEEELGREFMIEARKRFRFIEDPYIVDYVNGIGQKILAKMPPQPFHYHFYVIRQEVHNAFAAPAGHIFINTGLITAMKSEDELAGILAHEIVHVASRHISQKIARSGKLSLGALAGMMAGIFLGVSGAGSAAANALSFGSIAATQAAELSYSRQDEMQADELGIQYLTRVGYDGKGLLTILKTIRDNQWFGTDQIPSYLMTHPAVEDRIAYLDTWIASRPEAAKRKPSPNEEFARVRTRLIAAYGDEKIALRTMRAEFEANPEDSVVRHGYGIALARNDAPDKGAEHVRAALRHRPFDPVMLKDLGEIEFMAGNYPAALKALTSSASIAPTDHETLYLLGRTELALDRYEDASEHLKALVEKRPDYKPGIYYLGEAYGKAGKLDLAHYHLGVYYQKRGDFKNALFHLKRVIKLSRDPARRSEAEESIADLRRNRPAEGPEPVEPSRPSRLPRPRLPEDDDDGM